MNKEIALVLSGGGARGLAHIGAIEELEENGFKITSIAGTSMGSVIGAVYAMGKMEEFKEWMYTMDRLKVFQLIDFTLSTHGLIKADRVLNKMQEFIEDKNIEDLPIPYAAIATDLTKGEEIIFREGSVFKAIRSSIAIPTVVTPVNIENSLIVDGGILNNIPSNRVIRKEGDKLVVINVNANIKPQEHDIPKEKKESILERYNINIAGFYKSNPKTDPANKHEKMGYFDLINKTLNLMTRKVDEIMLEKYPPDILIKISRNSCGVFDFYRSEELVETGRIAAQKSIGEYLAKYN